MSRIPDSDGLGRAEFFVVALILLALAAIALVAGAHFISGNAPLAGGHLVVAAVGIVAVAVWYLWIAFGGRSVSGRSSSSDYHNTVLPPEPDLFYRSNTSYTAPSAPPVSSKPNHVSKQTNSNNIRKEN